jgi:RimJ/RimL family protein N-acetyltransferase
MIVYRLDLSAPPEKPSLPAGSQVVIVEDVRGILSWFSIWVKNWGWRVAIRASLKVLSRRRVSYFTVAAGRIVQSGWANLGFCRHYPVEPKAVVFVNAYTRPEFRGKGLFAAARAHVIAHLYLLGHSRFYTDTSVKNVASQRSIEKNGFQKLA